MFTTLPLIYFIASVLSVASALSSIPVMVCLRQPVSFAWWGVKVFVTALSYFLVLCGVLGMVMGLVAGSSWITLTGAYGMLFFLIYLYQISVAASHPGPFRKIYGMDWESAIPNELKAKFMTSATALKLPRSSAFKLTQDLTFCALPGTDRHLLCDLWEPAEHTEPSGLAFIYLHGSAWSVLDKDFGTRPFFKHLANQGHVVMDVAYRLFPETDMVGMVNDVFRAISWMKANAAVYKIDPGNIVVGGASAGGQLALLAAYNSTNHRFIPNELRGTDLTVRAVVSEYGPSDLKALYYHTGQHLNHPSLYKINPVSAVAPKWVKNLMGKDFHRLGMDKDTSAIGVLPVILGCEPDDCPELYAFLSPVSYVHNNCPPTLILQGAHDLITPVAAARSLYKKLRSNDVPAVLYILPQTDHAFDLILPQISPVSHCAFYILERFLAMQINPAETQSNDCVYHSSYSFN